MLFNVLSETSMLSFYENRIHFLKPYNSSKQFIEWFESSLNYQMTLDEMTQSLGVCQR